MKNRILVRIIVAVVILAGIGGYSFFEFRNLIRGPMVVIDEPNTHTVINDPVTNIRGHAKNISEITLNDRDITVDEKGEFNEKIVLANGLNTIKVMAKDKFGRQTFVFVEVMHRTAQKLVVQR